LSYAPNGEDGRSIIMSISMINGAPTSWESCKLSGVARSSTDAEYCGQSVAAVHQA
jgi:hypothetical protein